MVVQVSDIKKCLTRPWARIQHDILDPWRSGGQRPTRVREDIQGSLANLGWPITMDSVDRPDDGCPGYEAHDWAGFFEGGQL